MRIEALTEYLGELPEPGGWVRVESVLRPSHRTLHLHLAVCRDGRGRKRIGSWVVLCEGVREVNISDFDGGGFAIYSSKSAAARQYTAAQAELRWPESANQAVVLGTLYQAHVAEVDDWIPFERYAPVNPYTRIAQRCIGPAFLLKSYARRLKADGIEGRVTLKKSRVASKSRLRVIHFGSSFVVAERFTAEVKS